MSEELRDRSDQCQARYSELKAAGSIGDQFLAALAQLEKEVRVEEMLREQDIEVDGSRENWASTLSDDSIPRALERLLLVKRGVEGLAEVYTDDYCRTAMVRAVGRIADHAGDHAEGLDEIARRLRTVLGR